MSTTKPLPKTVKLGGTIYRIEFIPDLVVDNLKVDGVIFSQKPVIWIDAAADVSNQWQILWHELVHAMLTNLGIPGNEHPENIVDGLGRQISWLLAQNGERLLP